MEGVLTGVLSTVFHPRAARVEESRESQLLRELDSVRESLETVSSRFDNTEDPDMVEACIYEMQALTARYRSLLREAKHKKLSRPAFENLRNVSA